MTELEDGRAFSCCGVYLSPRKPIVACRVCGRVYLRSGMPLSICLPDLERASLIHTKGGYEGNGKKTPRPD